MERKEPTDPHTNGRSAGILLHITSLPSAFGTGDLGPEAKAFVGFLHRTRQSYWQVLPLNPTAADQGYSPYSATSSMAGNTLLISPESLVEQGWLTKAQIDKFIEPVRKKADFPQAQMIRKKLFTLAHQNFLKDHLSPLHQEFQSFCEKEDHWLHDFALYSIIKKENKGSAWYTWKEPLKLRNPQAISEIEHDREAEITHEKWKQFVFYMQWKKLKTYCNQLGIHVFGDLPFYVSYDSADVWANQEIFKLDSKGNMKSSAGVPPDYFNENGQLWGMPLFNWKKLKGRDYDWWVKRIRKNMELYDLIRLDHFRAFSSYWEVPPKESTAVNGSWKKGPGSHFFQMMQQKLGQLPFVAEDLGDIDDAVYRLRDAFSFPGMKVLQFAFDGDMPKSEHIPHNYSRNFVVYTGTHDNNTSKGWFEDDLSPEGIKNLRNYLGKQFTNKNIHRKLIKTAYASVAKIVIVPIQDVLGLGKNARMNTPATTEKNWLWRIKPGALATKDEKRLKKWAKMYNRITRSSGN